MLSPFPQGNLDMTTVSCPGATPCTIYLMSDTAQKAPVPITIPSDTVFLNQFTLYLPFAVTTPQKVDASALISTLTLAEAYVPGTKVDPTVFRDVPGDPAAATPAVLTAVAKYGNIDLNPSTTLFIPFTSGLPSTVSLNTLFDALATAEGTGAPTASSNVQPVPGPSSASGPTPTSDAGGQTSTTKTSSSTTTTSTPPPANPTSASSSGSNGDVSSAALGGGIIGALVVGLLLGGLIAWFFRRKKSSSRAPARASLRDSSDESGLVRNIPNEKRPLVVASDMTGWQKHLPRDKDDGTISKAFKSIFEQTQVHIEGFYDGEGSEITQNDIVRLETVSSDGLAVMFLQAHDAVPILQALLIRWIIHRISGKSSVQDSLLRPEYAVVAVNNGWHMEADGRVNGASAEQQNGQSN